MTFKIVVSPKAEKQLEKLDKESKERIIAVLKRIRIRPFPHIKKLVGNKYYSARAGKYRIILDIKDEERLVQLV